MIPIRIVQLDRGIMSSLGIRQVYFEAIRYLVGVAEGSTESHLRSFLRAKADSWAVGGEVFPAGSTSIIKESYPASNYVNENL